MRTGRMNFSLVLAIALAAIIPATLVKQHVAAIEPTHAPFLLYFGIVAISAWLGGRWAAIVTIAMCVGAAAWTFHVAGAGTPALWARVPFFIVEALAITLLIDVLNRQRAVINESRRAAESSRLLLDGVFETVPSAIVATEADGRIMLFNRAAEELTGYSRDEVIGKSLLDLFVPESWQKEVLARFADPHAPAVRQPHRNPWRTKQGVERLIEWRCAALPGLNGTRILGAGIDVTELRKVEEQREEAAQAKDRFLATISHELRGPLTAITGWTQMLLMREQLEPEFLDTALRTIDENARNQARLVDDLLDYARVATGAVEVHRSPVRLDRVLRSVVDAFSPEAERKKLLIRHESEDVLVLGDELRLRQVFMNILQNAIRYTDQGHVELRAQRLDSQVVVTVTDTGQGIAPEFLPHVFERFVQAEQQKPSKGSQKGLGLGLAIVRDLVTLHGGHVAAESQGQGQGTRISVSLPIAS